MAPTPKLWCIISRTAFHATVKIATGGRRYPANVSLTFYHDSYTFAPTAARI